MADINIRAPLETAMFVEQGQLSHPWREYFGTLKNKLDEALARIEVEIDAEVVDLNVTGKISMDDVPLIDELRNILGVADIGAETIELSGNATIGGGATITGDITGASLDVSGEVESATLNVTSDADVGGDLGVTGEVAGATMDLSGNADVGGDLDVAGDVAGATATMAGAITGASLDVTGEMESATANITGDADVGGDLDVTGDVAGATATIAGAITGASIDVTGELGGATLDVSGDGDIDGALTVNNIQIGDDATYAAFYAEEGDVYSEGGRAYFGEGINTVAERYGVGLQIREAALTKTEVYSIGATFTAATAAIYKAGETFATDGVAVSDFFVITGASDASYIGSTGEIISVAEETIVVSIAAAGAVTLDDLTSVNFVVFGHPVASILDNGDIHFRVGVSPYASFKIEAAEANSQHVLHLPVVAGVDGHSAVELDIDADTYGGVSALRTNYDATGFDDAATIGTIHDVVIDNTGATDGEIHVIDVAVGDPANTDLDIAAVGTHPGVKVVHQVLGTAASITSAWSYDTDTYTDRTTAFSSAATDVEIFPSDNDYIYIAAAAKWDEISVILATPASHTIIPTFEFVEDDGTWTAFTPSDDTNGFQQNGSIRFASSTLTDWGVRTINEVTGEAGADDYYWMRIRRTRGILPTPPTEDTIKVITHSSNFTWDENGNEFINTIALTDGITAPDAIAGRGIIYIDAADGDLKVKFGDGTVKTIVVDT